MYEILIAWFGFIGTTITIGVAVDTWLVEDIRIKLSDTLRRRFTENPAKWFNSVEETFSAIFDSFYSWRNPELDKFIWRGILFTYVGLILARLVLWALRIPVPAMEKILVIAFVSAIGVTMLLQVDFGVLLGKEASTNISLRKLIRDKNFISSVVMASLSASLFSAAIIMTGHGVGITFKNVSAIAFGTGLAVPAVAIVSKVRDDWIPVSPLRAIASSLFFIGILAILFPSAAYTFVTEFEQTGPLLLASVAFNVFGDALSLVETRWVLRWARGLPLLGILGVLIMDVLLSAVIYLVLPGISNVNWNNLIQAIQFEGPEPWMGILFWSTFLTSILFYLFVISILLLRIITSFAALFNRLNEWFAIYQHPVRLVTIAMVITETIAFAIFGVVRK
jgi:hypothetical protein